MTIREFAITDHDSVLKLWDSVKGVCTCKKCMFLDSREQIEKYLARNPGMSFVAEENEIIGVVLAGHDGRTGLIYRLTVSEEFHNNKIGSRLVDRAVQALKKEGLTNVKAFVLNDNHGGNAFWEKIGFKENDTAVTRVMEIV
jgi:ribosomal protein S18 acetylase RimI-like enzyme